MLYVAVDVASIDQLHTLYVSWVTWQQIKFSVVLFHNNPLRAYTCM